MKTKWNAYQPSCYIITVFLSGFILLTIPKPYESLQSLIMLILMHGVAFGFSLIATFFLFIEKEKTPWFWGVNVLAAVFYLGFVIFQYLYMIRVSELFDAIYRIAFGSVFITVLHLFFLFNIFAMISSIAMTAFGYYKHCWVTNPDKLKSRATSFFNF